MLALRTERTGPVHFETGVLVEEQVEGHRVLRAQWSVAGLTRIDSIVLPNARRVLSFDGIDDNRHAARAGMADVGKSKNPLVLFRECPAALPSDVSELLRPRVDTSLQIEGFACRAVGRFSKSVGALRPPVGADGDDPGSDAAKGADCATNCADPGADF